MVASVGALLLLGTLLVPAHAAPPACGGKQATIVGTGGADRIVGTPGADVIVSRGGNDRIRSRGGADLICSGAGNDRVWGGGGKDRVIAGGGNDLVNGGDGRDRVNGGTGIDSCRTSEVLTNCEADLATDVRAPATVAGNDVTRWTFGYSNKGPSPAPATTLTITLAPRFTVKTLDTGCSEGPSDTVTCQLGKLGVQGSGEVVIMAEACDDTASFEVSAVIDASTRDHSPGDNTDSRTNLYSDLDCEADLDVDVQGPVSIIHNDVANWTFDYSNKGPSPAPGTTLTITFDPWLSVNPPPSGCVEGPVDMVTCQLAKLGVQGSGEVVISVDGPGCGDPTGGPFTVSAVIGASTRDQAPADNTDSQDTAYDRDAC